MPGRENHSKAEAPFPFRSKVFITWCVLAWGPHALTIKCLLWCYYTVCPTAGLRDLCTSHGMMYMDPRIGSTSEFSPMTVAALHDTPRLWLILVPMDLQLSTTTMSLVLNSLETAFSVACNFQVKWIQTHNQHQAGSRVHSVVRTHLESLNFERIRKTDWLFFYSWRYFCRPRLVTLPASVSAHGPQFLIVPKSIFPTMIRSNRKCTPSKSLLESS
jgi:hypothetical protein